MLPPLAAPKQWSSLPKRPKARGRLPWAILGLCAALSGGCATQSSQRAELGKAVAAYNELMRWKKFDAASAFRKDAVDFIARYAAAEDDLSVEHIEVRAISFPPVEDGDDPVGEVLVMAQAYLLPSTVLEKIFMKQKWTYNGDRWLLDETSRELVPPLPEEGSGAPAAGLAPSGLDQKPDEHEHGDTLGVNE